MKKSSINVWPILLAVMVALGFFVMATALSVVPSRNLPEPVKAAQSKLVACGYSNSLSTPTQGSIIEPMCKKTPTPEPKPSETPQPEPSDTPAPTDTDVPATETTVPTETEMPTTTPEPSSTPEPSATATKEATSTATKPATATSTQPATATATQPATKTATATLPPTNTPFPTITATPDDDEPENTPVAVRKSVCFFDEMFATVQQLGLDRTDVAAIEGGVNLYTEKVAGNSSQPDVHPLRCSMLLRIISDGQEYSDIYFGQLFDDGAFEVTNLTNSPLAEDSMPKWIANDEFVYLSTNKGITSLVRQKLNGKREKVVDLNGALSLAALPNFDIVAASDGENLTYISLSMKKTVSSFDNVYQMVWTPNGRRLITLGFPMRSMMTGFSAMTPKVPAGMLVLNIEIAPDGRMIGLAENGEVYYLNSDYSLNEPVMSTPTVYQFSDLEWKNANPAPIDPNAENQFVK